MATKYHTMFQRLVANSEKPEDQNENGCWVWTGRTCGKRWPYGRVNKRVDGKLVTVAAHREMENECRRMLEKMLLSEGETLDHLCTETLCINPDHWQVVTLAENSKLSQQRNPRWPQKARSEKP